ncbi:MAG: endo-1,3-alpha-glucanase family glycosylhydrolase [Dehalococcoidia bacterium]|nr:endo-1,3-alpha-glucanase family glycosylhydrolase [Dehalococcoidia bacterium]
MKRTLLFVWLMCLLGAAIPACSNSDSDRIDELERKVSALEQQLADSSLRIEDLEGKLEGLTEKTPDPIDSSTLALSGTELTSHYLLRFEFTTTSDWASLSFDPAPVLSSRQVSVSGDYASVGCAVDGMHIDQSVENARAENSVTLIGDYAISAGYYGSASLSAKSLQLTFKRGDLNESILRVYNVEENGRIVQIAKFCHDDVIKGDVTNLWITSLDLSALSQLQPLERAVEHYYEPLVWAFYYPWYNNDSWNNQTLLDKPATLYSSDNAEDISRQITEAKGAGIDGFLSSWWGPGDYTDENLEVLLDRAERENFKVAAYFETISGKTQKGRDKNELIDWLTYLLTKRAIHPAYERVDGRPLIVVWASGGIELDTWKEVFWELRSKGLDAFFICMGFGDAEQLEVFDGLHDYGLAATNTPEMGQAAKATRYYHLLQKDGKPKLWAATVMSGYDDRLLPDRTGAVLPRNEGETYRGMWANAVATDPDWIFITSWNEWWENTQIESSALYGDSYLGITRSEADSWQNIRHGYSATCYIDKAVDYLRAKYNGDLHLIRESDPPGGWQFDPLQKEEWAVPPPWSDSRFYTMDKVYWLGDSALAALALEPYAPEIARDITQKLTSAGYAPYSSADLPDILFGGRIEDPPPSIQKKAYIEDDGEDFVVIGGNRVDSVLEPISDYADVLLEYAIQEWRKGDAERARQYLRQVLEMFDSNSVAIWDRPAMENGVRNEAATYKLALLLIVVQVLDEPFVYSQQVAARIRANQDPISGGIRTGIKPDGSPAGGCNTETTSLVLLAGDKDRIDTLKRLYDES